MKKQFSRRDFLKLAGALPAGLAVSRLSQTFQAGGQNVIIVVFDSFSAYNISLHGYDRQTTPNIARLAERAIVYHNHFAGGNFTTPGTASLLTGALPWTHRGFRPNSRVADEFASRTFFNVFNDYYRIAYTHNGWAQTLLKQFSHDINELIPPQQLMIGSIDSIIPTLFGNDEDIASVSWVRNMKIAEEGHAYSLLLSHLYQSRLEAEIKDIKPLFPRGLPTAGSDNGFLLESAVDTIGNRLVEIRQPFIGYFHFLPPHRPYRTSREFFDSFNGDGYKPEQKPIDIFGKDISEKLTKLRMEYDEFILYCDREFSRFFDQLESSGLLENTWLVLTSDHGEMFERGIAGHMTNALYQPVVRIPLMIFEPGRRTRLDIHEYTSAIDVLPTLATLSGKEIPSWAEGAVLPPFSSAESSRERNIFLMRANLNDQFAPLTIASTMLVREGYKLHYYFGYPETPGEGVVRLFDIVADPEEMVDLASSKRSTAMMLLDELKSKLREVDEPYR